MSKTIQSTKFFPLTKLTYTKFSINFLLLSQLTETISIPQLVFTTIPSLTGQDLSHKIIITSLSIFNKFKLIF